MAENGTPYPSYFQSQIATGLVGAHADYIDRQRFQQHSDGPHAVAAAGDATITFNIVLKPIEMNGIAIVDMAALNLSSDASGSLSALAVSAVIQSDGPANNGFAQGEQVSVPAQSASMPKTGGALIWGFSFPPFTEDLTLSNGANLVVTFTYSVRNTDAVNPHNVSAFAAVIFRSAKATD